MATMTTSGKSAPESSGIANKPSESDRAGIKALNPSACSASRVLLPTAIVVALRWPSSSARRRGSPNRTALALINTPNYDVRF